MKAAVTVVVRNGLLEQGRSSQPSTQLLGALARALRLSDDERDHLFHLAGHQPPPADGVARLARAGLVRMLNLLGDTPALVLSDLGEILAQNQAAVLLTGDHTGLSGDRRYVVYRWFTEPATRAVCPPDRQEYHARLLVADFRASAAPATPQLPGSSTGCKPRAPTSGGSGPSTRWRSGVPTARPFCTRG